MAPSSEVDAPPQPLHFTNTLPVAVVVECDVPKTVPHSARRWGEQQEPLLDRCDISFEQSSTDLSSRQRRATKTWAGPAN